MPRQLTKVTFNGTNKNSYYALYRKTQKFRLNPVDAGLVYYPEDYIYSSATDYAESKGLLDNVIVFQYFG